jgi:hypothetical protein
VQSTTTTIATLSQSHGAALDSEVAKYQGTYAMKLACEKTNEVMSGDTMWQDGDLLRVPPLQAGPGRCVLLAFHKHIISQVFSMLSSLHLCQFIGCRIAA